ncbi:MAG: hypothetical protein AAB091_00850 [Elusimicrobiota bacterium]
MAYLVRYGIAMLVFLAPGRARGFDGLILTDPGLAADLDHLAHRSASLRLLDQAMARGNAGIAVRYDYPLKNSSDGARAAGRFIPQSRAILLHPSFQMISDDSLRRALILRTLTHELWHAYVWRMGLDQSGHVEETAPALLGTDAVLRAGLGPALDCAYGRWRSEPLITLRDIHYDACQEIDLLVKADFNSFDQMTLQAHRKAGLQDTARKVLGSGRGDAQTLARWEKKKSKKAARFRYRLGLDQIEAGQDPRLNFYLSLELFAPPPQYPEVIHTVLNSR